MKNLIGLMLLFLGSFNVSAMDSSGGDRHSYETGFLILDTDGCYRYMTISQIEKKFGVSSRAAFSIPPKLAALVSVAKDALEEEAALLPVTKEVKRKRHDDDEDDYQFFCRACKTTEPVQTRSGPEGSNTLCNACGLKWAKMHLHNRVLTKDEIENVYKELSHRRRLHREDK